MPEHEQAALLGDEPVARALVATLLFTSQSFLPLGPKAGLSTFWFRRCPAQPPESKRPSGIRGVKDPTGKPSLFSKIRCFGRVRTSLLFGLAGLLMPRRGRRWLMVAGCVPVWVSLLKTAYSPWG